MCIDREQLDKGSCHQNAGLQKAEQAVLKSVRSRHYGFVDAVPPARERLRCARAFVSPWELPPHSTLVDKAAVRHVERC